MTRLVQVGVLGHQRPVRHACILKGPQQKAAKPGPSVVQAKKHDPEDGSRVMMDSFVQGIRDVAGYIEDHMDILTCN